MKRAQKAYKNLTFLNSSAAREIRILSELIEPRVRFKKYRVNKAIVFYGSARIKDSRIKVDGPMSAYYEAAEQLAQRLVNWTTKTHSKGNQYYICTGGGPGIMEAANKGAYEQNTNMSLGLNISLKYEQIPNAYISPHLNFEYHYFFTRKFWFFKLAKALVVFPGGFGTCDELFELLTLVQTDKVRHVPIILFGESFWRKLINFDYFAECGLIDKNDLKLFQFVETVDEAFDFLTGKLNHA
ncbi:MAG: TIGR00730 family Rossman fold protein [Calditrichaeota bacterium]|nr:TIGR00730 family Rossman fold protein [Calditrichota bacterium]